MKKHTFLQALSVGCALFILSFQSVNAQTNAPSTPEPASPVLSSNEKTAQGSKMMVVSAHPEATKAGYHILQQGGSAMDAAVAVQLVLGLVEPQSSGIGGSGYTLYYDRKTNQVYSFDGRETAPSQTGQFLFTGEDGKAMDYYKAAIGGRAVGVPGTVRLLEMVHKRFGVLQWKDLFVPAVSLAEKGFTVTPRLSALVDGDYDNLSTTMATRLYFMPDAATPIQAGDTLTNEPYARVLRRIANEGSDAFYTGDIAESIVKEVREYRANPGLMSIEDLSGYKALERKTVCGMYRAYMLCTMGESSAGGIMLLEALGILEQFNLSALGKDNPQSWHLIAEASRLAMVDRNYYLGDPHYVQSPGERLFGKDYVKARAALIQQDKVMEKISEGIPQGWKNMLPAAEPVYPKPPGTTHFTIVDSKGNIVSMTGSVGDAFGSRMSSDGFMLNNELTDFSFTPEVDGKAVVNRPEGGKRPRSSMAPTIIFAPDGKPFMSIGTAGGTAIPGYILQRIVAVIDWGVDLDDALAMPNIINRGNKMEMEDTAFDMEQGLRAIGHPVEFQELNSGLTAIQFKNGVITGAADPRREGTAMGQ